MVLLLCNFQKKKSYTYAYSYDKTWYVQLGTAGECRWGRLSVIVNEAGGFTFFVTSCDTITESELLERDIILKIGSEGIFVFILQGPPRSSFIQ